MKKKTIARILLGILALTIVGTFAYYLVTLEIFRWYLLYAGLIVGAAYLFDWAIDNA